MYLANNTHLALVLSDSMQNADSKWHCGWPGKCSSLSSPKSNKFTEFPVGTDVRDPAGHTPQEPRLLAHPTCACTLPYKSLARWQPLGKCPSVRGRYPDPSMLRWAVEMSPLVCKIADSALTFLCVVSVRHVGRSSASTGWHFSCYSVLILCGGKAHCLELAKKEESFPEKP